MTPPELFSLARLCASVRWPQLAPAVWALREPVPVEGLLAECGGAIATDMKWCVYYDPEAIAPFTVGQAATALVHEAWHCLRRHGPRVRDAGIAPQWYAARAMALDVEVNGDMVRHRPAPEWAYAVPTPADLKLPDGLPWEQYFPAAMKFTGPCHVIKLVGGSSMDGVPRRWDRTGLPGVRDVEEENIRRKVARNIAASPPGTLPGGWRRWVEEVLSPPKVPWQRLFAALLRGGLATAQGAVDYTHSVPNRRQAVTPVQLPVLRRPLVSVDVVLDTSGSMGATELKAIRDEVEGIIKSCGASVRAYVCDAEVHGGTQRVRSAQGIKLAGGGGTDMGVGIAFAEAQRPRADVLVVLTDGMTPWPERRPRFHRVIVVLVGAWAARATVPAWAHRVEVPQ